MYKLVNALEGKILLTAQADNCIRLSNAAAEKLQELSDEANTSPEEFLMNLLQKASEESIIA